MDWSSVHRGDFKALRRGLTIALLEAEALEPRVQLAYSRGEFPAEFTANMSLLRLLLQRAEAVTRQALDVDIADTTRHFPVYSDKTLAGGR